MFNNDQTQLKVERTNVQNKIIFLFETISLTNLNE